MNLLDTRIQLGCQWEKGGWRQMAFMPGPLANRPQQGKEK